MAASISMRISSRGNVRGFLGLHHQHALQHAAIDQRHAQERVVRLLARFAEIFEARMTACTCSTATGSTCSATSPASPSLSAMRSVPMHSRTQAHASRPGPGWRDPAPADKPSTRPS